MFISNRVYFSMKAQGWLINLFKSYFFLMQSCFKQSSYSFYCNTVSSTVLGCSKLIKIMLCFVWFVFLFVCFLQLKFSSSWSLFQVQIFNRHKKAEAVPLKSNCSDSSGTDLSDLGFTNFLLSWQSFDNVSCNCSFLKDFSVHGALWNAGFVIIIIIIIM